MRLLLDTAPWINGVTMPHVLPARIRSLLAEGEIKGLCSVSLLEAATLHRLGRFDLKETLSQFFAVALSADIRILELTPAIAAKTNDLSDSFHGDPFDRTIISTAAVLNLTLVTSDPAVRAANLCAVEFYPFKPSRSKRGV